MKNSAIVVAEKTFSIEESKGAMKILIPEVVIKNYKFHLIVLLASTDYKITAATKQSLVR